MNLLYMNVLADIRMVVICYAVLLLAFIANVVLSLYFNISMCSEVFESRRLWHGVKKAAVLMVGTLLMVTAVDAAGILLTQYAVYINEEVHEFITVAMITATIGVATWRYIKEAYRTFIRILNGSIPNHEQDEEG